MPRASFAVSLSPTVSASVSIALYVAISSCSFEYSVLAFLSIFSSSPVPRSMCSGPLAAETAFDATPSTVAAALGPARRLGLAAELLDAPLDPRACALVSLRCC